MFRRGDRPAGPATDSANTSAYGPPSRRGSPSRHITDLWAFIEQQTATLGHISGEGRCEAARED